VEWGAGLVTAPRHDGARVAGDPLASSLAHAAPHPPQGVGARPGESSVARESQARNERGSDGAPSEVRGTVTSPAPHSTPLPSACLSTHSVSALRQREWRGAGGGC